MALADRGPGRRYTRGPRCLVDVLMGALDDADRATLTGWLEDAAVPTVGIWRALVADGHQDVPSKEVFGRHRRGDCACRRRIG